MSQKGLSILTKTSPKRDTNRLFTSCNIQHVSFPVIVFWLSINKHVWQLHGLQIILLIEEKKKKKKSTYIQMAQINMTNGGPDIKILTNNIYWITYIKTSCHAPNAGLCNTVKYLGNGHILSVWTKKQKHPSAFFLMSIFSCTCCTKERRLSQNHHDNNAEAPLFKAVWSNYMTEHFSKTNLHRQHKQTEQSWTLGMWTGYTTVIWCSTLFYD